MCTVSVCWPDVGHCTCARLRPAGDPGSGRAGRCRGRGHRAGCGQCRPGCRRECVNTTRPELQRLSRGQQRQDATLPHKTIPKHLSKRNIEITFEVKVRSKVEISRFDVWGPGNRVYGFSVLKLRRYVPICMDNVCYDYKSHTEKSTRSGHKRSLYVIL